MTDATTRTRLDDNDTAGWGARGIPRTRESLGVPRAPQTWLDSVVARASTVMVMTTAVIMVEVVEQ